MWRIYVISITNLLRRWQLLQEQQEAEEAGAEGQLHPGLSARLSGGSERRGCWPPPSWTNLSAAASPSGDSGNAVIPLLQVCTALQPRFQSVYFLARPGRITHLQQSSFNLINCAYWCFLCWYNYFPLLQSVYNLLYNLFPLLHGFNKMYFYFVFFNIYKFHILYSLLCLHFTVYVSCFNCEFLPWDQ